eukprot:30936-Pelagococcus_subviridis.AAC.30
MDRLPVDAAVRFRLRRDVSVPSGLALRVEPADFRREDHVLSKRRILREPRPDVLLRDPRLPPRRGRRHGIHLRGVDEVHPARFDRVVKLLMRLRLGVLDAPRHSSEAHLRHEDVRVAHRYLTKRRVGGAHADSSRRAFRARGRFERGVHARRGSREGRAAECRRERARGHRVIGLMTQE